MNNNEIAFFIGLFGSVHCIGMCGPLAFAIPAHHARSWLLVWDKFIYNAGRTISYSALGLITGVIGKQLWLSGLQQWVSILTGVFIVLYALSKLFSISFARGQWAVALFTPFQNLLRFALTHRAGHLVIGMLNGLLPCGFVYLALLGAMDTASIQDSVQYMFWFGTGTMPLMLAATVSTGLAGPFMRRKLNTFVPYAMLCLGVWFMLRGMQLNIPYLSPAKQTAGVICK